MKIGRNDLCPCGSGKKYKHCCLRTQSKTQAIDANMEKVSVNMEKGDILRDVFREFISIIKREQWYGACHAISASLYVVLKEIGFSPELCVGEVLCQEKMCLFDHSWIQLDGQIYDLAIGYPLLGIKISEPIFMSVDLGTMEKTPIRYGVKRDGLGLEAKFVLNGNFVDYMNGMPKFKNGLWSVVQEVCEKNNIPFNLEECKSKYDKTKWSYIINS